MIQNNKIKVTIVVPVYNVEKYINRCFNSIVNQSYDNIECIFVDDSSVDNSYKMLNKNIKIYQGKFDFRIIRHIKNRGLSVARNTGTLSSTGDYIYYLDSDDIITSNCIKLLANKVQKYKGVDMVQGNAKSIPGPTPKWLDIKLKNFPEYAKDIKWIKKHFFIHPRIPVTAWNKLIRKEFLIKNNLFFKEGIIHEDCRWIFDLSRNIKSIAFSKKTSYIYYRNPKGIKQNKDKTKSIKSWLIIIDELLSEDNNISSAEKKYIFKNLRANMLILKDNNNLFLKYRYLIKKNTIKSVKCFKLFEFLFLFIFLLSPFFYRSFLGKKITIILIKLI